MRAALVGAAMLAGGTAAADDWPEDRVGPRAPWDAAYDEAGGRRFIPMQLIVPAPWNGAHAIDFPPAGFVDIDGDRWSGPVDDVDAFSGRPIRAYARERENRREGHVQQRFAVRAEQDGLGRTRDSRFGGLACAGELKFPLGEWREGETRRNEYACSARGAAPVGRVNVITIERLDFTCRGIAHCLQFRWTHRIEGREEPLDDRRYVFAPGLGEIAHDRLR